MRKSQAREFQAKESQVGESQAELRAIHETLRSIHVDPQPDAASRTNPPRNVASLDKARSSKASPKTSVKRTSPETHPAWQSNQASVSQPQSQPQPQPQAQTQSAPVKSIALPPIQPLTAEPNESLWDGQVDWQRPSHRAEPLADTVARLQEKSTQYLQQLAQSVWDSPAQQVEIGLQQLEAQAQHVNELATTQEAALLELKAIAKQIEHDWKTLELNSAAQHGYPATDLKIPAFCEYKQTSVPLVEKDDRGVWMVAGRSIDWFKAEREAELTAQALRHRATQPPKRSWAKAFSRWLLGTSGSTVNKSPARRSTVSQPSANPNRAKRRRSKPFTLREGAILVGGAMGVRIVLNLLVAAHPILQLPAIALMVAPGAIALYRSTVTPNSMLAWSGRLMAIMLGFWLAGRLFF